MQTSHYCVTEVKTGDNVVFKQAGEVKMICAVEDVPYCHKIVLLGCLLLVLTKVLSPKECFGEDSLSSVF